MKHLIPTLALTTLVSASAFAQVAPLQKAKTLSYDRIALGYEQNDVRKGVQASFSALLGSNFFVTGTYRDAEGRDLDISGTAEQIGIGARFAVGPGDLVLTYSYKQEQLDGAIGNAVILAVAESDVFGIAYRYAINSTFEVSLGLKHEADDGGILAYNVVADTVGAQRIDTDDTPVELGVRFNLTKEFDISLGYSFGDNDTWTISAGYNF